MSNLFHIALLVVLVVGSATTLGILVTLLHIGRDRWAEAGKLSQSTSRVIKGEVETDRDGMRDHRVSKGKVWNKATRRWERQGKLSDEYVQDMIATTCTK